VAAGRQAYVVCPRIGDDPDGGPAAEDGPDGAPAASPDDGSADDGGPDGGSADDGGTGGARPLRGVLEMVEELRATPALKDLRIEVMHGRLPADQRDATMRAFAAGEVDVLVSTTVIEVGVDVPNA